METTVPDGLSRSVIGKGHLWAGAGCVVHSGEQKGRFMSQRLAHDPSLTTIHTKHPEQPRAYSGSSMNAHTTTECSLRDLGT